MLHNCKGCKCCIQATFLSEDHQWGKWLCWPPMWGRLLLSAESCEAVSDGSRRYDGFGVWDIKGCVDKRNKILFCVKSIICMCCAAVSLRHVLHSVRRPVQPGVYILTMVCMHNANQPKLVNYLIQTLKIQTWAVCTSIRIANRQMKHAIG